jgi:predicted transcriptional regulator
MESGDDSTVALKEFGEAQAMFDYIAKLNPKIATSIQQRIADEFGSTTEQQDATQRYQTFVNEGGTADAELIRQAAAQRAEARAPDMVDTARRNAIYALDRDEARAKNDPAYIVSRSDAIDILTTDMDDQTRRDIATIIDSGNSLGIELRSVLEDQFNYNIDELPEPTPGANVNEAIGRITGRIDLIRRTGEGVEKVVRKAPGFKETNASKIDAMLAENATMQSDLEALKQERAKIERALQPLYETAWMTKPKGKQPAKKRKKRLPPTEEEIKLDRQLKDIDGQIEQLIGRINANAESLGAEKIAVPNPVKAEETATFRDTNPQKRADDIAATRLRIAQLNGIAALARVPAPKGSPRLTDTRWRST